MWEAECLMDVELLLEGQARWEADSPHHLILLHEMFQHASEQGQKDAECMICQGCQHGLLQLDPKAEVSAIQLVGPHTRREEFISLYYEVYKLWRLLGSPAREPELVAEVLSSLEDHQGQKGSGMLWVTGEPNPTDVWPPRSRTPRREKRDASAKRSLFEVREAHQKALATVATLEEEIEQLSCPLTRSWSEARTHSKSRDCCRCKSRGQNRRCCQVQLEDCHAPYFKYHPSWRVSESKEDEEASGVNCFLWRSVESSEEENVKMPSPRPPIEELEKWVTWRAWAYETPNWWQELVMVPGVDDHKKVGMQGTGLFSTSPKGE